MMRTEERVDDRQRRLESLERLAGGVAHDMNNLLGVVLNYAAFIAESTAGTSAVDMEPAEAGTIRADAEQITRAAQRATELSRRLLAFAGREPANPTQVDLSMAVRAGEPALRASLDGLELRTRLTADPPPVAVDPAHLERVLGCLVENAREAMPDGGALTISTGHDAGRVWLAVSDTGTGMPADVAERAVEPFFSTRTGRPGLGLSITYGLVKRAGGELTLESEPGEGSTVRLTFPAASVSAGSDSAAVA